MKSCTFVFFWTNKRKIYNKLMTLIGFLVVTYYEFCAFTCLKFAQKKKYHIFNFNTNRFNMQHLQNLLMADCPKNSPSKMYVVKVGLFFFLSLFLFYTRSRLIPKVSILFFRWFFTLIFHMPRIPSDPNKFHTFCFQIIYILLKESCKLNGTI